MRAAVTSTSTSMLLVPTGMSTMDDCEGVKANMQSQIAKRGLMDRDLSFLNSLGALAGVNSFSRTTNLWIGTDGDYTTEFINESGEDVILACWGPSGSWINAVAPLITTSVANSTSTVVSFAEGASGSCAGIYPSTTMVNGQVSNTWFEFTFADPWSTVDVSRLVNMNGNKMTIVTPSCVSDMDTCVFVCNEGESSCWLDYHLINCDASNGGGKGADANLGGADSGGCNGITKGSQLKTYLSS
jgi:hypothetical protein